MFSPGTLSVFSYFGLNPRVRQSGDNAGYHGRITKQGRSHPRAMLVEVAWSVSLTPGPLRVFIRRVREKRGNQIAAAATARKLTVVIWHMLSEGEEYVWSRPALVDWKLRKLELVAGYSAPKKFATCVDAQNTRGNFGRHLAPARVLT
ncbi:transposase, partial [uncultured Ruegeria sp.]|uniref:transposase n=1 Tax=uncultured Ruegeria sp. TaxID=259304 RepID=UPI002635B69F